MSQICQREGGLCSDIAFFQSKDNIFMVEMQFFGSLEAYALREKVADSGELPLPARKRERSQCSDC